MQHLTAYSVAPDARDWMIHTHFARVLNIFDLAINLINERGEVCSIVSPDIGNGPFNTVLIDPGSSFYNYIDVGSPIIVGIDHIEIGEVIIDTHLAAPWQPGPDWKKLHARRDEICTRLLHLIDWILGRSSTESLIKYLTYPPVMQAEEVKSQEFFEEGSSLWQRSTKLFDYEYDHFLDILQEQSVFDSLTLPKLDFVKSAIKPARDLCSSIIKTDIWGCCKATRQLAGLGPGLTPAGDDFILGAILAARVIHPEKIAVFLTKELADAAAPLTTSLSAAWLRAAGRGEAAVRWHDLFGALCSGQQLDVQKAIESLLAIGHTSGADSLAGFLGTLLCFLNREIEPCLL